MKISGSAHDLCFGLKKYIVYPCIPQFYYIEVGFKGVYISRTCFPDIDIVLRQNHCTIRINRTFNFNFKFCRVLMVLRVNPSYEKMI